MTATAGAVTPPRSRHRHSPVLGVVAVVLAGAGVTMLPTVVSLVVLRLPLPEGSALAAVLFFQIYGVSGFLALTAVLGLAAVILGRGRWWGAAAIVLAVAGSPWFSLALLQAFPPAAGKG